MRETNPQQQPEVTVDETQTAENSGHIPGLHDKKFLENDDQPPENNDAESADQNGEILGNEDKNVPENPGNREILGDTDKNVLEIPENDSQDHIATPHSERTQLTEPGPTNPRSEKYDLRHNPKPNCNDDYRY